MLVTFANKAKRSYSIMAHGVSFSKLSEGAPYLDGKFWLNCCIVTSRILESADLLLLLCSFAIFVGIKEWKRWFGLVCVYPTCHNLRDPPSLPLYRFFPLNMCQTGSLKPAEVHLLILSTSQKPNPIYFSSNLISLIPSVDLLWTCSKNVA